MLLNMIKGVYDFEAVQRPVDAVCVGICEDPSTCHHKTFVHSEQTAGTYSLVLIDHFDNLVHSHKYSGEDAAENFVQHLLDIEPIVQGMLQAKQKMDIAPWQMREFEHQQLCHICDKWLGKDRVRDHCHLSGRYCKLTLFAFVSKYFF
jgi:hypothetical protein